MNCKPGDMAIVLQHPFTIKNGLAGKVVVVVEYRVSMLGLPVWHLASRYMCQCKEPECAKWIDACPDELLWPIIPPDEDDVNETTKELSNAE
jgi:hypothetical protein